MATRWLWVLVITISGILWVGSTTQIECTAEQPCKYSELQCPPNEDCHISCNSTEACFGARIECPFNAECVVSCNAVSSCSSISIAASSSANARQPQHTDVFIDCNGIESCANANIYAQQMRQLSVSGCTDMQSCSNLTVFCPPYSNHNANCFIAGATNVYAIHGTNDLAEFASESSSLSATIFCGANYEYSCAVATDEWSCADSAHHCNHVQEDADNATNAVSSGSHQQQLADVSRDVSTTTDFMTSFEVDIDHSANSDAARDHFHFLDTIDIWAVQTRIYFAVAVMCIICCVALCCFCLRRRQRRRPHKSKLSFSKLRSPVDLGGMHMPIATATAATAATTTTKTTDLDPTAEPADDAAYEDDDDDAENGSTKPKYKRTNSMVYFPNWPRGETMDDDVYESTSVDDVVMHSFRRERVVQQQNTADFTGDDDDNGQEHSGSDTHTDTFPETLVKVPQQITLNGASLPGDVFYCEHKLVDMITTATDKSKKRDKRKQVQNDHDDKSARDKFGKTHKTGAHSLNTNHKQRALQLLARRKRSIVTTKDHDYELVSTTATQSDGPFARKRYLHMHEDASKSQQHSCNGGGGGEGGQGASESSDEHTESETLVSHTSAGLYRRKTNDLDVETSVYSKTDVYTFGNEESRRDLNRQITPSISMLHPHSPNLKFLNPMVCIPTTAPSQTVDSKDSRQ